MTTSRLGLNRVELLKNLSSYTLKRIWKGLAGARPKRESHMAQSASIRQSALIRQSVSKDSSWVSNQALAHYNTPLLHAGDAINESAPGWTPVGTSLVVYHRHFKMLLCIPFIVTMLQSLSNLMLNFILGQHIQYIWFEIIL